MKPPVTIRSKSKSKDNKNNKPLHYISSDGFDMYVGKNNLQNDELTFGFAVLLDIAGYDKFFFNIIKVILSSCNIKGIYY